MSASQLKFPNIDSTYQRNIFIDSFVSQMTSHIGNKGGTVDTQLQASSQRLSDVACRHDPPLGTRTTGCIR